MMIARSLQNAVVLMEAVFVDLNIQEHIQIVVENHVTLNNVKMEVSAILQKQ